MPVSRYARGAGSPRHRRHRLTAGTAGPTQAAALGAGPISAAASRRTPRCACPRTARAAAPCRAGARGARSRRTSCSMRWLTGTGMPSARARRTTSPFRKSTAGSRPRSMATSIEERRRRYLAPTASSRACLASSDGEPGPLDVGRRQRDPVRGRACPRPSRAARRSAAPRPPPRSSPRGRAGARSDGACSSPRRSPPMVPSELMAQLIASLLQRAPRRLWVTSTGADRLEQRAQRGEARVVAAVEPAEHEAARRGAIVDPGLGHRSAPDDDRADHPLGADQLLRRTARRGRSGSRPWRRPGADGAIAVPRRLDQLRRLGDEEDEVELARRSPASPRWRGRARRAPLRRRGR